MDESPWLLIIVVPRSTSTLEVAQANGRRRARRRVALLAATLTAWAQSGLGWSGGLVSYDHWLPLGLLCGAAAMAGDSVKSFVKRRIGIAPGRPWIPFDQLDYVVAGLLAEELDVAQGPERLAAHHRRACNRTKEQ